MTFLKQIHQTAHRTAGLPVSLTKGLVTTVLLMWMSVPGASEFVPLPAEGSVKAFRVHPKGQVALLLEQCEPDCAGTLYVDGAAFVSYGPGQPYEEIYEVALTGSKAIFSARVREDLVPDDCGVRGNFGVFDSPTPIYCAPGAMSRNLTTEAPAHNILANANGSFAFLASNLRTFFLVAPDEGFFFGDNWAVPTWRNNQDFRFWSAGSRRFGVLADGTLVSLSGNCVRRHIRQSTSAPTGLALDGESCGLGGIIPSGSANYGFNPATGSTVICGTSGDSSSPRFFLIDVAGNTSPGPEVLRCPDFGENLPINDNNTIAYSGRDDSFNNGILLSSNPNRLRVATGHIFQNQRIVSLGEFSVTNDNAIVVLAELEHNDTGELTRGVFYSDGDTDFPDPPEPDEVIWTNTGGGSFGNDNNWDQNTVPNSDQVATFNSDAGYQVSFGGAVQSSRRVRVQRGQVDFAGGTYTVLSDSAAYPGVNVAMGARLDLVSGHQLTSEFGSIGVIPDSGAGPAVVGVLGNGANWLNAARLLVGDAGWGQLLLLDGASTATGSARIGNAAGGRGLIAVGDGQVLSLMTTGNLAIGYYGTGELQIEPLSVVDTDQGFLGFYSGSTGTATVEGQWTLGELIVGTRGHGQMGVTLGQVDVAGSVSVGQLSGSMGNIDIGLDSAVYVGGDVTVGDAGTGELFVSSGGQLSGSLGGTNPVSDMILGQQPGSSGAVVLSGVSPNSLARPSLVRVLNLRVGDGGDGDLSVLADAYLEGELASVGVAGTGSAVIDHARWVPRPGAAGLNIVVGSSQEISTENGDEYQSLGVGTLIVRNEGILDGDVIIDGPESSLSGDGTITGGITLEGDAVIQPGNSPGTLTIGGDLTLQDGVIEIEIDGLAAGQYDRLDVGGAANLNRGVIRFIFSDYLPQQGDELVFLDAATVSLGQNMTFEYEGAAPGFQFELNPGGAGQLVFTANSNAVSDHVFANGFEQGL
ncbi:MAG: hypothetical protein QNJ40_22825 [Xanthomonadales bacterium]|nr:hypothetical protein [Xanthomonadales bacterium]